MDWDDKVGMYVLRSGRTFYAHAGILGLSPDGELTHGYDGGCRPDTPFTIAERVEIAALMMRRWLDWVERGDE